MNPESFGVLLFIILAAGMGVTILLLIRIVTRWLKMNKFSPGKYDPYECGVPLLDSSRERFSVKFYLVALIFILFDIETVFLLPYAVAYKRLGAEGFWGVAVFVGVLGLGLFYIIKRRVLKFE
jgi:NADH-quinone oxidoreductase subunit A